MSYRGFEPNAIGSIVPPFAGGSAQGGGPPPSIADHFAPTIIVGNVLAGDPAAPQAAPFQYIGDPGDGSAIAAALASLPLGGWLHIRRGTYTISPGLLPLAIPANVRVTGDGVATILVANALDRRLFTLAFESQLADLRILLPDAALGATGTALVDASIGIRALIANVEVLSESEIVDDANESLTEVFRVGVQGRVIKNTRAIAINRNPQVPVAIVRLVGGECVVSSCNLIGANDGVVIGDGAGGVVHGNTITTQSADAIRVELGASDSIVLGNLVFGQPVNNIGGAEAAHNI